MRNLCRGVDGKRLVSGVPVGDNASCLHRRRDQPLADDLPFDNDVGVRANQKYGKFWWGEGEVKMYIDGDKRNPTLCGTGAEDYCATAWGLGRYMQQFHGAPVVEEELPVEVVALETGRRWEWQRRDVDPRGLGRRD